METSVSDWLISDLISLAALAERWGEFSDFLGDYREALAGVAGAGGFDAGVEREQIGLEGDLVDDADDLADLAGGFLDTAHRRDSVADDRARFAGALLGLHHHRGHFMGALRGAAHGGGDLVERGGCFFQ